MVLFYEVDCYDMPLVADYNVIHGTRPAGDSECPMGANDICDDPRIDGPLSGEAYGLRLQGSSPAIDSGLGVGGLVPAYDYLGEVRPLGAGVDRGAYEMM